MAQLDSTTAYTLHMNEEELRIIRYALEFYRHKCHDNPTSQHSVDQVLALEHHVNND